jgi:hypothetical protein
LQIAAYEVTVKFNDGYRRRLDVIRCLDTIPEKYAKAAAIKTDEIRIKQPKSERQQPQAQI